MGYLSSARERGPRTQSSIWQPLCLALLLVVAGACDTSAQYGSRAPTVSAPRPMPSMPSVNVPRIEPGVQALPQARAMPPAVAVPSPPPPPAAQTSNRRRPQPCWCYGYNSTYRTNVRTYCSYDCCSSTGRNERCSP